MCPQKSVDILTLCALNKKMHIDTKTLVTSLVLSRLDYCNSLLAGIPQNLLHKIQKVMNGAAHLVFRASKRDHISPLLSDLH